MENITIKNPHGEGFLVVNTATMKPLDDMAFKSIEDADKFSASHSFDFNPLP